MGKGTSRLRPKRAWNCLAPQSRSLPSRLHHSLGIHQFLNYFAKKIERNLDMIEEIKHFSEEYATYCGVGQVCDKVENALPFGHMTRAKSLCPFSACQVRGTIFEVSHGADSVLPSSGHGIPPFAASVVMLKLRVLFA